MTKRNITPDQIEAVLPQTQCGLCSYDGCKPYAEAIANNNEAINLCPPGGVEGLKKLGELTQEDPTPFIASMKLKEKPYLTAVIREQECIGCTKCIQACPVDAIMGAAKLMHTVITDECTGCELCIEPCPVDCIDLIEIQNPEKNRTATRAPKYKQRYQNRNLRLAEEIKLKHQKHQDNKLSNAIDKKAAIRAALLRKAKNK